jgi:hypothetical protein
MREIALSQTYPRYYARDFERRWQKRLSTPPRRTTDDSSPLHVEVTHHFPAPNRYSWELRPVAGLPVEESRVQFASWETASTAGKLALNQFLQTPLGSRFSRPANA